MITVNSKKVEITHFPDGTCGIFNFKLIYDYYGDSYVYIIRWKYESDEEYIQLKYIVDHIRSIYPRAIFELYMPFIPNARMDRTKNDTEIFTLKYFSDFINSLKFDSVYVLDPHSDVSVALINNVRKLNVDRYILLALSDLSKKENIDIDNIVIYFPDAGAYKRYKDSTIFKENCKLYGNKTRDWSTGKILGIKILDEQGIEISDFGIGKVVLMIDDIISYGGTLAYSADKIKELGAKSIYAYATHVENSIDDTEKGTLLKRLNDDTVKLVYTTDSLYSGSNEKVVIIENF